MVIILTMLPFGLQSYLERHFDIWFLDVGQGDAILIRTSMSKYVLIDVGRDNRIISALEEALPPWISNIDMVLLTHPDQDHIGGFEFVIEKYNVRNVVYDNLNFHKPEMKVINEYIQNAKINSISLRFPDNIYLDENTHLKVLWRDERYMTYGKSDNDSSLTIYGEHNELRFLLSGDLSNPFLEEIVAREILSNTIILKASHHGSKTGTSENLLNTIGNSIVIYSVGKNNSYHHPSAEVVDMVRSRNLNSYRTDLQGTIQISCNDKCFISTKK